MERAREVTVKTLERKYRLGDQWRNDFDYVGMLKAGMKVKITDKLTKLNKLFDSFEDVNYHTASAPLWTAIKRMEKNEPYIEECLIEFRALCKKELED